VQHAGITQTDQPPILVDHTFKHAAAHDSGTLSYVHIARNTIGVTAACLLVSRRLFLDIGGFDETAFGVAYNDVDFCFRVENAGYRNVYTPTAELTHHEGASRGFRDDPRELANFRERYGGRGDRYLNPNFSRRSVSFEIQPTHVTLGVPRRIRAIIVTHNLNFEGAPKAIFETACCLSRAEKIEPVVFAYRDGPLRAQYEAAGITVVIVPAGPPDEQTLAGYERSLLDLERMFQDFSADVVVANTLDTFNAVDAAHEIGIPSLWVIHESEGWRGYFRAEVERRALACFGHPYRVVFVADATRQVYADLDFHHNATVIPGGIDRAALNPFLAPGTRAKSRADLGLADTDRMILMLGTVCERKGQIDLALALRHLDPRTGDGHLRAFIVGDRDNDYSRDLRAAVSALPAAWRDRINIVPETPDVWPYYAAADLFVFTSRMESYPRVLMEAMAFGLPIITTPVNGIVEQVRPGVNAAFYQPGDVAALAALIGDFLGDPKRRAQYGANSVAVLRGLNTHADTARMIGEAILQAAGSGVFPTRVNDFLVV
jgi:glycosyltransferase involved in cell wall biosynthesis